MLLGLQQIDNLAETEARVTLDEDGLILEVATGDIRDEFLSIVEEACMRQVVKILIITAHVLADADEAVHPFGLEQLAHTDV